MRFQSFKKVFLGITLITVFCFIGTPQARSTDGGAGYILVGKELGLDVAMRAIARALYQTTINQLLSKIQGGGTDGAAAFVQNWRNFQTNAEYRGEDVFKTILAHTNVCNYLSDDVKRTFRVAEVFKNIVLKDQNTRVGEFDPFTLRAKCSLPEGFNILDFQENFAGNGGWNAFARLNEFQNNPFGLVLESLNELDRQRALEVAGAVSEATSGGGYTAFRKACEKLVDQPRCVFLENVKTPADLVAKTAGLILDKNLEWLTNADELSEVLASLLTGIFNYFDDLSQVSGVQYPEGGNLDNDRLEYCSAKKPRPEVILRFKDLFNPYGYASLLGSGPCGDPSSSQNRDNPYPYQACVQQCLKAVEYIPSPVPVPTLPDSLPAPSQDGGGGQCTGFGSSTCPEQGGGQYPNCGTKAGSLAYDLRVHHMDLYTDPSGARYLWNIGAAGDPNNPATWAWLEAPPASDAKNWCEADAKQPWVNEHGISSPVSTVPPYQGARCIDGSAGVCSGSSGTGSGGDDTPPTIPGGGQCGVNFPQPQCNCSNNAAGWPEGGTTQDDFQFKNALHEAQNALRGRACGENVGLFCSDPNLVADGDIYMTALKRELESAGLQAYYKTSIGDIIWVRRDTVRSEHFDVIAGGDEPFQWDHGAVICKPESNPNWPQ